MDIKKYLNQESGKWAIAEVFFRCNGKKWVGNDEMVCGLVLSAQSQWNFSRMGRGNKHGVQNCQCRYCDERWIGKKGASRFVVIYDGVHVLQLILDEPPTGPWNLWVKERIEYYMRMEPNDAPRDTPATIPSTATTKRLAFAGPLSDKIWEILYSNPDMSAMEQLDVLAQKAINDQALTRVSSEHYSTLGEAPGASAAASSAETGA